ncbi:VanZ family protein [Aeromicrobium sp. A1-2]|uniref:VanZ family protein n=1 Tax=Aeromicrobium sp. A1-2 TaxID=2107713 RepID=UPI0013C312CD|nr:VanZ family protein [Aeromicrobium sp. A1-2]
MTALAVIGLWPRHVDEALGLGGHWWYSPLEFGANIVLFVPLGILSMLVARRAGWHRVAAAAFALSGAIELAQGLGLPGRTGAWQDVIANTTGAALGAAGVFVAQRRSVCGRVG